MTTPDNVILFGPVLEAKRSKERVSERLNREIADGGWTLAHPATPGEPTEIFVYLMDEQNASALAFGNTWAQFQSTPKGTWLDFVNAWDVISDPAMAFDSEHLAVTAELARRAIVSGDMLPDSAAIPEDCRLHLIMLVDRDGLTGPVAVVSAVTHAPFLDSVSVRAVLAQWVKQS